LPTKPNIIMKSIENMVEKIVSLFVLFMSCSFFSYGQEAVPFTPRLNGGNIEVRGDIIFVGNNILNRASQANPSQANSPYSGTSNNNSLWMEYIDIDTDDNTFSSSSAELNIADPACSQVRYAGLYWAATYPNDRSTNSGASFSGTPRIEDWNEIKFKVPGGDYIDLIADNAADPAGEEDEIIFDGYDYNNINNSFKDSPYICYKNVTDLVRSNPDPNGEYTVANVRATRGKRNGSSSAGWVMVIIYENPNESGKFISTFDGYAGMSSSAGSVDVPVNGFKTLPVGFPVRARIGVGALEGDRGINNDRFYIKANSNASYTNLSTTLNPNNNFFNSTITVNGAEVPTRTPYGTNTLGTDLDLFNLNNPNESVLPNNETGATLRFTSTGDGYGSFLATFAVEIIEPDIVLEKRVQNIAGDDITGLGVNLGQTLDYVLTFKNVGNDHATGIDPSSSDPLKKYYTIRDVLPVNTTFISAELSGAPGATYVIDNINNEVTFIIPDNLINIDDPKYEIRMRVKVAENCFDFVDACTNLIQNLAYSTYAGVINNAIITDDPSVSDFDNCGFVTPGATNFLLDDLASCNFTRTVKLCGNEVLLDAGDNFDSYVWVKDDNENGIIDPSDTVLNDGDPDNDPSTLLVDDIGTYIVDKIVADPCKGFKEIIHVERFGETQTNPIVDYFNTVNNDTDPTNNIQGEIVSCSIDGDLLPKIFLCGVNDTQLIQINITDAQSMVWEQLDENSCITSGDDCANKNATCTWSEVNRGNNFTASAPGKYRLVINYQNGCFSRFYFNVFQNTLGINFNKKNIVCETPGNITVTNLSAGYGYQLVDVANNNIIIPFSNGHGPSFDFTAGENGSYRVEVVQLDSFGVPIPEACIFSTPEIGILDRDFVVEIQKTPANCNAQGTIKIDALNVLPNYSYELRLDDGTPPPAMPAYPGHPGGTLVDDETAQPDNTHTFNVNPGTYFVITRTDDGCIDIQSVTVDQIPDPTLSALTTKDIGCGAGTIDLTITGGQGNPDFLYAIWSKNGTALYTTINDIDPADYQTESTFTFGWRDENGDGDDEYYSGEQGDYVFVVIDANNCHAFSNQVTIRDNGPLVASIPDPVNVSCSGNNDGEISIVAADGVTPYRYSIDGGANFVTTANFVGLSPGDYDVVVQDDSGCEVTFTQTIVQPFPLSASAGVSRDATCDPIGAEVRVTNVTGGTAPYTYSFDGGTTYGTSSTAVLPPGDYSVIVKDASCLFPMAVTVEDTPTPPTVVLTPEVNYNCNGTGNITATPDISTYNYTYMLDGVLNSPDPTSNVFPNITPGTYTVRTNYTSQTPPTPSLLLSEDFGSGITIPSPNTVGYQYEDQTVNPPGDNNRNINDYEYSVTSNIEAPFGSWANPVDHTTGIRTSNGRYLVINIGTPSPGQVIYSKTINDVIHNQPLRVSLWMLNLLRTGTGGLDPDLTIEIREIGSGTVVESIKTGSIPKNTGNNNWINRSVELNPGANSSLEFVIRTDMVGNNGNDIAIDDIEVYQVPEVCEQFVETLVVVEPNQVFEASITSTSNATCNGTSDGTITFEVSNFNAVGFEYSINGDPNWLTSTSSPVTPAAALGAGTHTVDIRKVDDPTCTIQITRTITEPTAVITSANITSQFTCANTGATITASATGGTPGYEYQLEDPSTTVIRAYQATTTFTNVPAGTYIIRAKDIRGCEDIIDSALTVVAPTALSFTATPTLCYTGGNDAEIEVNVTGGNSGLLFSINGGSTWITPTPTNATTYTFDNLASGDYIINVKDQFGCTTAPQTITIDPELSVTASAPAITACESDTDVTITALGGDGNYVYAIVSDGATPTNSDFSTTNPIAVTAVGEYDVYVRDNAGAVGFCSDNFDITITQNAPISITETITDVSCFGGNNGAIDLAVTGGNAPYRYSIDGGTSYQTSNTFPNLIADTYSVLVQDADLCTQPLSVTVNEPLAITAEAEASDYTCLPGGEAAITVGSNIPTAGGSGDYQYSINGGTWTASTTGGTVFTGLTDGTYTIRVRDANATTCFITLPNVVIAPLPVAPTLSSAVAYNCDGSGNITISPFDATYSYAIDGNTPQTGVSANIFNDITAGNHTITVDYGNSCTTDIVVNVANGRAFSASITSPVNVSCFGGTDGGFTINASNFGAGGFEYTLDGGTTFLGPHTTSQVVTGLSAQAYTIEVRDVNNPTGCTVPLNQTLSAPNAITATASITAPFTCDNTGATITAIASGGTPTYTYQLETNTGTIIRAYQGSAIFNNVPANSSGENYVVRITDSRNCTNSVLPTITVNATEVPTFDVTPTACYSGANDGTIQVDVTSIPGNENFQFRINGGSWLNPNTSSTRHIFTGLANGSYTIDVQDGFGCDAVQETVVLSPQLMVSVDTENVSSCADGTITVNATGGNGILVYAIVPANTDPTGLFTTTNTLTITNADATANPLGYDVYVRDNNGVSHLCSYLEEDIIINTATALAVSGTSTDPECYDGLGTVDASITGGNAPFNYTLVDLSPADGIDYGVSYANVGTTSYSFGGVGVGDYRIDITDTDGCPVSSTTVTINNAVEITADIVPILPPTCDDPDPSLYGFEFTTINSPTGSLEYSADGGTTWQSTADLRNHDSGSTVFPSIRVTLASGAICQKDFPRYVIPYPLDDLDITLTAIVVGCNDLQVTVEGSEGNPVPGYQYTYTDDPANFNTFILDPNVWTSAKPSGTSHTFQNTDPSTSQYPEVPLLIPGRTYVFYVKDGSGCIRQSTVNVNEIPLIELPIEITTDVIPTCDSATSGSITFNLNPENSYDKMRWEVYKVGDPTPIAVSGAIAPAPAVNVSYFNTINVNGLAEGDYYIDVIQVTNSDVDACRGASENTLVDELKELTATPTATRDISCNLPGLISITGITGGGGAPYTFDVTSDTGFSATGLTSNPIQIPVNSPAGNYTVTMYDQYSCPVTLASVPLSLSPNPTINTVTQDNCSAPIQLNVDATSAAGNIRYAIVPASGAAPTTYLTNSGVFNNVAPGSYDVYIIDGNGCIAMQPSFIVDPILSAKAELTKLLDCSASPDATITIEALTGSGNYEYSISGAATVAQTTLTSPFDYTAASAGDYIITIYDTATPDNASCNRIFTVNVPTITNPQFTETHIDVTCNGANDGSITLVETNNNINPLVYELRYATAGNPLVAAADFSFDATTKTYSDLAPGDYIVRGLGTNGCLTNRPVTITELPSISVPALAISTQEFACTSGTNTDIHATITVNPTNITGGSGTYIRYVFENTVTSTIVQDGTNNVYTETNRTGGTYNVTVYDDKGCFASTTATINAFDELLTPTITVNEPISCANAGEDITINAFGSLTDSSTAPGLSNYEFRLVPDPFGTSNVFNDLPEGIHTFEVKNVNTQCLVTITHRIDNPNVFDVAINATTDVICYGTATGTATFTVTDTNGYPGTYSWEIFDDNDTPSIYTDDTSVQIGDSSNLTATGLIAGEYYVTFSQDGVPNCENRQPFSIDQPTAVLSANTIVSEITCAPTNNGIIEIINATGGWGTYGYYVSTTANPDPNDDTNYISTPKFDNLVEGTYEVWIKDAIGCAVQLTDVVLTDPTPITADLQINKENCSNFEGEIQVINPLGGQGSNYSYQLQRWDGSAYVDLRPKQTTDIFSNLGAGQYQVLVNDQWGCIGATSTTITLYDVIVPKAEVVKLIDCISGGQITITQTGGSGTYTYAGEDSNGAALVPNTDGIFTGLTETGEYTFTITDSSCSVEIKTSLVAAIAPPTPTIEAFTNVSCFNAADGSITVSVTDNGIDPYSFQITDRDGTPEFINPTSFTNTSAEFTGLANTVGAGYTITVTGSNNCSTTVVQTITQPTAPVAITAPIVSDFICTTGNTTNYAIIDVTGLVTGGSSNYVRYVFVNDATPGTPVQDGSNSIYTETNLAGGNYTITAYDDMGCSATTTAIIPPFVGISAPTVDLVNNVTCNGNDEDISVGVTITPASATPNLSYEVTSTNGYSQTIISTNTSQNFTGLGIGNYIITITNTDTGCLVKTTHVVSDPKIIEVSAIKATDETCLNDSFNGGSFNVTIANYTGGYNYQVFRADGSLFGGPQSGNTSTPLIISDLPGGSYYVQITETDVLSTLCSDNSNAITINAPEFAISAIMVEEANVNCTNDQGKILVDPSGGKGPYSINIASATQNFTQTGVHAYIFPNLSAGTFDVTITDALGCVLQDVITLVEPNPIVASISPDIELTCYGDSDGVISATINSGGLGTPRYKLNVYDPTGTVVVKTSVYQAGNIFNNLPAGIYSISIADDGNCGIETSKVTISDPVDVLGSLIRIRALSCTQDAQLLLTANGGTGPYEYSLDGITYTAMNGGNTHTFTVPAGAYRYYVRDSFGCKSILSNEIKEDAIVPLSLTMDTTAAVINCNGDNTAILIAKADGGLGNYRYELFTDASFTNSIAGPQISGEFNNLTVGSYFVQVTSEDCIEGSSEIIIMEPAPLVVNDSFTNVSCNGAYDGSITVSLSGGSGGYQYAISPDLNKFDTINTFTDLAPGNYTIIAQDLNGCFEQLQYTLTEPAIIVATPTTTPEICIGSEDGTISLNISGGTAPYSTSINSTTDSDFVMDRTQFTGLAAGTYAVFVKDAQGCMINMAVTIDPGVILNATVTPVYTCTTSIPNNSLDIILEDASVAPDVMYALNSTDPNDMVLEPNFTNIAPGNHYIAIAHANGCVLTIDFEIEAFEPLVLSLETNNINEITAIATGGQKEYTFYFDDNDNGTNNTHYITETKTHIVRVVDENGCETIAEIFMEFIDIEIPNFFTPNSDGNNDLWSPKNQEAFPKILTIIFDRYGREVYRMGLNDQGWDGLYKETELPSGDYWYVIKLKGEEDNREFVGHFTLYR